VLDNLSAHKTNAVKEFLEQNPRVRFHFTPTYSSWMNQVGIWFVKILGGHPKAAIRGHFNTGHREGGKTSSVIAQRMSVRQG
jgi:hypothetical protein